MSQTIPNAQVALKNALYIGIDEDLSEAVRVSIMTKYQLDMTHEVPHVLPEDLDIIFIEYDGNAKQVLAMINQVLPLAKGLPVYILLKDKNPDFIIEASHQGVQGFIECPNEVFHILSILHMQDRRRQGKNGIVSTLFSLKGGVGCTAIATNLAANIADMTEERAVLVDLNVPLGDTALYLDMEDQRLYTITDFIYNLNRFDENLIYKSLSKHQSGLYLLPLPSDVSELDSLDADMIKTIIESLRKYFDHVIIDCASDLSETTLSCLDESDNIVLVAEPSLPSIRATNIVISLTQRLGYLKESIKLILNRNSSLQDEMIEELVENLEVDRVARVHNDFLAFQGAMKKGELIKTYQPDSKVNSQLHCIANMLHNGSVQVDMPVSQQQEDKPSFLNRLYQKLTPVKKNRASQKKLAASSEKVVA